MKLLLHALPPSRVQTVQSPPYIPGPLYNSQSVKHRKSVTMRKAAIIASTILTAVVIIVILIWRFYPRSSTEIVEPGGKVIKDNALVSLFAGSSLLKGGSSSFVILGLIALAVLYICRKKKMRNASAPPATVMTSPPLSPSRNFPMESYAFLPSTSTPFNPTYMRAITHEQETQAHSLPSATGGPVGPLTREQIGAVLAAANPN